MAQTPEAFPTADLPHDIEARATRPAPGVAAVAASDVDIDLTTDPVSVRAPALADDAEEAVAEVRTFPMPDYRATARPAVWRRALGHVARVQPPVRLVVDIAAIIVAWSAIRVLFVPDMPLLLVLGVYVPVLALARLYAPTQSVQVGSLVADLPRLLASAVVATLVLKLLRGNNIELRSAAWVALIGVVCMVLVRGLLYAVAATLRWKGFGSRATLVVGHGDTVPKLVAKITKHPEYGLHVVGTMHDSARDAEAHEVAIGARPSDLPGIVTRLGVEQLILVPGDDDARYVADCFMAVDGIKVQASLVPPLHDFLLSPADVEHVEGIPLISLGRLSYAPRMMPGKRAMDFVGGILAVLLFSPLLAAIALAIKLEDPKGPVFFSQRRAGHRGRYFKMIKFRSMCVDAEKRLAALQAQNESDGLLFKMKEDPRITRVGRFIRKTSLDELPQLFNVVKGDMSLVGPRALPVEVEHFGDIAIKRLNVRPGCTGFWQVLGRSDLGYDEMVKLDLAYIQNWSLWVDVQLLLKTIPVIVARRGAY